MFVVSREIFFTYPRYASSDFSFSGSTMTICHTCGNGMAFVYERLYNRLNIIAMKTTSMFIAYPSSIINLIDRDDGKKKQTLEKAPSVALV